MKEYLETRQRRERTARMTGIILTVGVHLLAGTVFAFKGIKYIWPPPAEQTFLIDFTEEEEKQIVRPRQTGNQPRSEDVDRTKPIELIQRSKSPVQAPNKQNLTPATKQDDFGDVDTPEIKQEAKLDPRASFPGMAKKDTTLTAPHTAETASNEYKAGQPAGNTERGRTEGRPNAHLKGRNAVGGLPSPSYGVQKSGVVVVTIWVDQYGTVQKAQAGAEGTTVVDNTLWAAARKAALGAHFNMSADAPALQQGTITYVFNLK